MFGALTVSQCLATFPRRLAFLLLIAGGIFAGLVFPFPLHGRVWSELFNLAHAPVFCLLVLAVAGLADPGSVGFSRDWIAWRPMSPGLVIQIAGSGLLLGLLGELAQSFVGRSPSVSDLLANSAGIGAAVLWIAGRKAVGASRTSLSLAAVFLLGLAEIGPLAEIRDAMDQSKAFPMLASFERSRELSVWAPLNSEIRRSSDWSTDGDHSLLIEMQPGPFSGATLIWPVGDWSLWEILAADVRNPDSRPLTLTLKITDLVHAAGGFDPSDRFEMTFEIAADSTRHLTIPLREVREAPAHRAMRLDRISAVELFAAELEEPRRIFFDRLCLERNPPIPDRN